jgi:adenylosuccinate lyase
MIDRYTTARMRNIWSPKHRWDLFLNVEVAYLEALEEDGVAPAGQAAAIRDTVRIDPERIEALEATLRHDVIAFLAHVEEQAGDATRFLHYGLTSSDVLDTVTALQLTQAAGYIHEEWVGLEQALDELADRHRRTPLVGRTHGMHAEATSFGLVVLGWREAVCRCRTRLDAATADIAVGKLSGAVGNLAFGDPAREARVLARLGLRPEPIATQVVARDRHAAFFTAMAVAGGVLDHIATNIRHLQRTEVGEAREPFGGGQRGSSAMPHKKNPNQCENVCGQARLLRAYALAALEDVALWHERDISHSSVERMIGPDATATLEFASRRLAGVIRGLTVDAEAMRNNLGRSGGIVHSEALLLSLVRSGMRRQDAYGLVQRCALKAVAGEGTFQDNLAADPDIRARLSEEDIARCFSVEEHLRWTDALFARRTPPEVR